MKCASGERKERGRCRCHTMTPRTSPNGEGSEESGKHICAPSRSQMLNDLRYCQRYKPLPCCWLGDCSRDSKKAKSCTNTVKCLFIIQLRYTHVCHIYMKPHNTKNSTFQTSNLLSVLERLWYIHPALFNHISTTEDLPWIERGRQYIYLSRDHRSLQICNILE